MIDDRHLDEQTGTDCPSEDALRALLYDPTLGASPSSHATVGERSAIAEHVDVCSRCQEFLERMTEVPGDLISSSSVTGNDPDGTICEMIHSFQRLQPSPDLGMNLERARAIATNIDDFDTVELIGSGGSGVLFRARHKRLERDVAIKVWPAAALDVATTRDRVDREAQALARLDHPHVVRVFDYGTTSEGAAYLVMEYVHGRTLNALIRQVGALSPRRAATLVRDVARALQAAHDLGLVHRDVKPANILLPTGEATTDAARQLPVKLVDFGLVLDEKSEHSLTVEGAFAGTPYYMSPEQIENAHGVDRRADVYSLGVVLYELLTATRPFQGVMRMVLHQTLHEDPIEPRKRDDSIPVELETICLKAMAKEKQHRYGTAAAFADDLGRWLNHEPIRARRPSLLKKATSWARRNPQMALMIACITALLVILGVGGPLASWRIARARDAAERLNQQMAAQRNQALATLHTMVFDIPDYLSKEEFSFEEIERSVLESALRGLEDVADWPQEPGFQYDTAGAVAVAHARLAGAYYWSDDNPTAQRHARRAIDVAKAALKKQTPSPHPHEAQSLANWFLANIALEENDESAAIAFAELAVEADRRRLRLTDDDTDACHDLLATLEFLVDALDAQSGLEKASSYIDEAILTSRALLGRSEQPCASAHLAHNLTSKARLQLEQGRLESARGAYRQALTHLDESELGGCIDLPLTIADCCSRLASIALQNGDQAAARTWREKGRQRLAELRKSFDEQPEGLDDWFEQAHQSLEP